MAVTFKIEDLIAVATQLRYYPQVGEAVNKALNAPSPIEYKVAIEEATTLAFQAQNFSRGYKSQLGTPLFMPLEFDPYDDTTEGLLLESSVLSLSQTKNMVITELQGRDSSVKEFINGGDYQLSVSGMICTPGYGYPLAAVKDFLTYMRQNKALRITHEMLNEIGVFEIVVTDSKLIQTPYTNCQLYSFEAISDVPLEMTITQ